MTVVIKQFTLNTKPYCDVIDITQDVQDALNDRKVNYY